jgi:hypothetical protein
MRDSTVRRFVTVAAVLMVAVALTTPALATASKINFNFNGTAIAGGTVLYFSAQLKQVGTWPLTPVTILLRSSYVTFKTGGRSYAIQMAGADLTFDPATTILASSTDYDPNTGNWITFARARYAGNTFLSATAFQVPASGLAGGITPVCWQGDFQSKNTTVQFQWQWACAVYTADFFDMLDYNALGVKPIQDPTAAYPNSDNPGTPEFFKAFVTAGATGNGLTFAGFYSGLSPVLRANPIPVRRY